MARLVRRLAAGLAHPHFPWWAALVGMLLALPALTTGLQLDDHLHRFHVQAHLHGESRGEAVRAWWDLYTVADGDAQATRASIELGVSPWWTVLDLRVRFWRPLSAATHLLDHALWPGAAWWMHAQNLLWYGALVVSTGSLLRRWLGAGWIAGLATLLFAIDEAHATPVGWIAQRNALIAAVLVVLALVAHDRWRRDGWTRGRWVGPGLLGLGLLASEGAIAGLGYLLAYAVWLEPRRTRAEGGEPAAALERGGHAIAGLRALWLYLLVVIGWRVIYGALGYGAAGSGIYVDPLTEPATYLGMLPARAAALASMQLVGTGPQGAASMAPAVVLAGIGLLLVALLPRLRRDRGLRVCLVGAGAAVLPAATAIPDPRMLLLVGIGASAVVPGLLAVAIDEGAHRVGALARGLAGVLAVPGLVLHAGLAPIALPRAIIDRAAEVEAAQQASVRGLPDDPALADQDLVIVNAPPTFVGAQAWLVRWSAGQVLPRRLRVLGATFGPVVVRRADAHTLVLQPVGGYFGDPFTSILRGRDHPLAVGDALDFEGWSVRIDGVAQGLPTVVTIRFDCTLDDPSLRWVTWSRDRFVPFELPAPGQSVAIPGSVADRPAAD